MAMRIVSSTIRQKSKYAPSMVKSFFSTSSSFIVRGGGQAFPPVSSSFSSSSSTSTGVPSSFSRASSSPYSTLLQSSSSSHQESNNNNHQEFDTNSNTTFRNIFAWGTTAAAVLSIAYFGNHSSHADSNGEMILFSGNANPELAAEIATLIGSSLGNITVARFADGEVNVQVHDNVRGKDVYIIQPTSSPVNEHLMELLLMVSTMRRASAERITCVIPYYGYARQDRKMTARVPISAADVARLLEAMGVDRVVAVDLHCGQIQGFFGPRVPVDNLDAGTVGVGYFSGKGLSNAVVVSPDAGGVYRAKTFREGLNTLNPSLDAGLAMIIKQRPKAGQIERMDLVGSVDNADVVIVDDMIDTAGTLCTAAANLKANGARRVYAFASHGLFSGPASDRIARSVLEEVVVTNTIPLKPSARTNEKIVQLSVAPLLAEAIKRVHYKQSVSELFRDKKKKATPSPTSG